MKLRKKWIFIVVVLGAFLCVYSKSSAFFTSNASIDNKFNIGYYEIKTNENFNPKDKKIGDEIKKEVYVTNTGTVKAFVRVKIVPFWKNGLPLKISSVDSVTLKFNKSSNWVKIGDFYYYKKVLNPKENTDLLLSSVTVNNKVNEVLADKTVEKYDLKDLSVDVFTESIICEDNENLNNSRLKEVWKINQKDFIN